MKCAGSSLRPPHPAGGRRDRKSIVEGELLDLRKYLAEKKDLVDGGLDRLLPGEDEYPRSIHEAMRYSLFAGGKRLRPILVLAACEAVDGAAEDALATACAFECVHTYSLIHDDLPAIDDDDMRRGRPTCHKVFGEAGAVLAGDALLTAAFAMIASGDDGDKARRLRVVSELARAAGTAGMIGGQVVDIESTGKDVTFPVLEFIHIHKTGELILAAVRCGAILGGADDDRLSSLTRYGEAIGLAFQIADDILDVEGSAEEMGKNTGGDELLGKATYPALLGMAEAKERAEELVEMAVDSLDGFGPGAEPLRMIARYVTSRTS